MNYFHITLFNCQKCNASEHLDKPSDIAYLTRQASEKPELNINVASRNNDLQMYVVAMECFIELPILSSPKSLILWALQQFELM